MELTGKCKEEFEGYLNKLRKHETERKFADIDMIIESQGYDFDDLPDSMKYGVLVDYFDSVFIDVNVRKYRTSGRFFYTIFDIKNKSYQNVLDTRLEAMTASIEKADELRNEVLNK